MLAFGVFLSDEVKKILDKFYKRKEIQKLAADYGLDGKANSMLERCRVTPGNPLSVLGGAGALGWMQRGCVSQLPPRCAGISGVVQLLDSQLYTLLPQTYWCGVCGLLKMTAKAKTKRLVFGFCVSTARLFHQAFISFRNYIMQSHSLDVDIHIVLNDITFSAGKCLNLLSILLVYLSSRVYLF